MRRRVLVGGLALILVAGCGSRKNEAPRSGATENNAPPRVATVVVRDAGIRFEPPLKWSADRLMVRTLKREDATAELGSAACGVAFDYVSEQPGHHNEPLLYIRVYDQKRWSAHAADGTPAGDELESVGDWVYVAEMPEPRSYQPGTLDADQFEAMRPTLDEVRAAFSIEGRGPSVAEG